MTTSDTQVLPRPPSLTSALLAGFDSITANLGLLTVPILFDLFLWLGPRLSLKPLVAMLLQQMAALPNLGDAQLNAAVDASQQAWIAVGERFNLFTLLRAYPVGLPSLGGRDLADDNERNEPKHASAGHEPHRTSRTAITSNVARARHIIAPAPA